MTTCDGVICRYDLPVRLRKDTCIVTDSTSRGQVRVPQIPLRHGFGKSPSTLPSFDHDSLSCCTAADTTKDDEEALSAMIAFNVLFNPYSLILTYFSLLLPVRGFVRSETDRIPSGQDLRPIPEEIYNSLDELARVVDVAYCVGSTGLQKPFQCLSHCSDLKGFELITVGRPAVSRRLQMINPFARHGILGRFYRTLVDT